MQRPEMWAEEKGNEIKQTNIIFAVLSKCVRRWQKRSEMRNDNDN